MFRVEFKKKVMNIFNLANVSHDFDIEIKFTHVSMWKLYDLYDNFGHFLCYMCAVL